MLRINIHKKRIFFMGSPTLSIINIIRIKIKRTDSLNGQNPYLAGLPADVVRGGASSARNVVGENTNNGGKTR